MTAIKMKGNVTLGGITAERAKYECVANGKVLSPGDTVVSFRGEEGTFNGLTRPPMLGKSAKVSVDGCEYYDRVFGIEVRLK